MTDVGSLTCGVSVPCRMSEVSPVESVFRAGCRKSHLASRRPVTKFMQKGRTPSSYIYIQLSSLLPVMTCTNHHKQSAPPPAPHPAPPRTTPFCGEKTELLSSWKSSCTKVSLPGLSTNKVLRNAAARTAILVCGVALWCDAVL